MPLDKAITWYIAGPMRGLPEGNIPLFRRVAEKLRSDGYTVISPAEMDSKETLADTMTGQELATYGGEKPGRILGRDVEMVHDNVGGIVFLPDWWNSRGARLEAFVGLLTNKKFAFFVTKGWVDSPFDTPAKNDSVNIWPAWMVRDVLIRHMP